VGEWHENSVRVVPWTVNKITDMEKIIGYGVDGLITDYPNRYFESINSK
jgi:glycerophosphoryl diester phosphodiesterase